MAKHVAIALPEETLGLGPTCVDWLRCCICLSKDTTNLICPAKNPNPKELNTGYSKIASVFDELKRLNYTLPSGLPLDSLDQGDGILQALILNQAKWHKKCYSKHVGIQLERLKTKLQNIAPEDTASSSRSTRSSLLLAPMKEELCFLCGKPKHRKEALHNVSTSNLTQHIESYAQYLQDTRLLATLSAGDLVAQEAKYHKSCLTKLFNRCRKNESRNNTDQNICEGMAFAELIGYMRRTMENDSLEYKFKVPDLITVYLERLSELSGKPLENLPVPHSTRFRGKILAYLPELKELKSSKDYFLVRETVKSPKDLEVDDFNGDAMIFQRFISNVRKTMLESPVKFEGELREPEIEVPHALLAVVNNLLYGSSTRNFGRHTKPALTICELIMFNAKSKQPKKEHIRHSSKSEPTIPIYIGLQVYSQFRATGLINKLHALGISISAHRVMEITSSFARLVVRSEEENVLCPSNFRSNLFTVAAIDNVDHNPSSTTSTGSFHGTSLSLYQLGTAQNTGQERNHHITYNDVEISGNVRVPLLPDHYGLVNEFTLHDKHPLAPSGSETLANSMISSEASNETWKKEKHWLEHISKRIADRDLEENDISWAAFHSSKVQDLQICPTIGALLPLFHEHAASAAMIHHGMTTIKNITQHLHPEQVPVMCADQPLYTLGKLIQWNCPEQFGEDKFVLLFGSFHIEQNFLRILGQFLTDSGWVDVVTSSGILEKGSAEAILKVAHVTKARAMHQVTAAVLHSLLGDAYETDEPNKLKSMDEWLPEITTQHPTAMYWSKVLNLEILLLTFVKAVREGNFSLYKESLKNMMPWFFAYDHSNYARWLAVHIKDMEELVERVPSVNEEFSNNGNFVIRKTIRPFSALGIDQAHEQFNAEIKGSGGAIGLTEDPAALRRFTISGPEINALLTKFRFTESEKKQNIEGHHEQNLSYQKKMLNRCIALKTSFEEMGNPFKDRGTELTTLSTRVVAPLEAVKTLLSIETTGSQQYKTFITERLVDRTKSLHDPIKRNKLKVFDQKLRKVEATDKIKNLKVDVLLFSRLFIVARERQLDLNEFFQYENQICPPSLSVNGGLRSGNKSDLAEKLEALAEPGHVPPSQIDGLIFDGAALVQMNQPKNATTFKEYFAHDLKPKIQHLIQKLKCKRIDFVWDLYLPNSLKRQEREVRGTGIRRQVSPHSPLPRNWSEFLRNDQNKSELFDFLGREALLNLSDVTVVTNLVRQITATNASCTDICQMTIPLHMEEADGRLVWHAKDMVVHGASRIVVRSSDTDVLVLLISYFTLLKDEGLQELWLLTGTAKKLRYVAVHSIANTFGPDKSTALRGFHAFTGCDTTSYFNSKGKKSGLKTWMSHPEITTAFACISSPLETLTEEIMAQLETFTCKLYDSQTEHVNVNEVRKDLFASKNKLVSSLPPTSAALYKHALRAAYQAGHIWGNALKPEVSIPCPSSWGWTKENESWIPEWSAVTAIWSQLNLLDHCGCKSGCETMRCGCRRVSLPCTAQCKYAKVAVQIKILHVPVNPKRTFFKF